MCLFANPQREKKSGTTRICSALLSSLQQAYFHSKLVTIKFYDTRYHRLLFVSNSHNNLKRISFNNTKKKTNFNHQIQ